ncbi:hypothetical protein SAMN05421830_10911 [Desulfomicrobium norvegicum]|uniref:Uncharacterized protein n=1 Tax=Desulfomicrobium norvegicum (strain DSM 1741 / NCIMB 8310) TaxID=52561 RepID=A0A8G2FF04_DESNO|nr:hypothetical protein [Desulfomicrobium norvegicum]SFL90990.1 hypothetical protein SAMN05421830_10911 [Desulfomicrobium norvegicum]
MLHLTHPPAIGCVMNCGGSAGVFILHLTHPPASREVRAERPDRVETWLERQVHRVHGNLM